jgi:PmbA protein
MDIAHERQRLREVAGRVMALARRAGASAEVSVSVDEGFSLKVRQGQADKVEFLRSQGLSLVVFDGTSRGAASTSDLTPASLERLFQCAAALAKHTQPDPFSGLAEAAAMAVDIPDLDLCHPWDMDVERALQLGLEGEALALGQPGIDRCEAFSVSTSRGVRLYANTHGLMVDVPSSRHSLGCSLIAREGEAMHRDSWGVSRRDASLLPTVADVAGKAADQVRKRLGARKIPTCRVPVLFQADIASGLIASLLSAISGGSLFRKSSFLLDSLGTQVLPAFLSVRESPRRRGGMGSSPIDGDGLATRDQYFVRNGEVVSYLLSTYSARKLSMQSTANAGGARNVLLEGAGTPLPALMKQAGTGLLVTELMGQGINLVTGDYSRGAAGLWIENGEPVHAVHEVTIAGNLRDMLRGIVGLGDDIDDRGNIQCGSILVEQMMVAGR